MKLDEIREHIGYQPVLLGIVALLASAALAMAASATGEAIAAAEAKDLRDSLSEVLPAGLADNDFLKDTLAIDKAGQPVTIYRARHAGAVKAAVFQVAVRGYAGEISILMAVGPAPRQGRMARRASSGRVRQSPCRQPSRVGQGAGSAR